MASSVTALVIGAGEFGQHYVRILSQLNRRRLAGVPRIEKLIITRTRHAGAAKSAATLRQNPACSVKEVIGAQASTRDHVSGLLKRYQPQLIVISARDKILGDTIHAHYAMEALNWGAVLCEKPFCNATGDGGSLAYFHDLKRCKHAEQFSLELPLAVVSRELMRHNDLLNLFLQAEQLAFHWEARDRGDHNVIDDLALHPWSLIPPPFKAGLVGVQNQGHQADIHLNLYNPDTRQRVPCCIRLRSGGTFRGLALNDLTVSIIHKGRLTKLVRVGGSLDDAVARQHEPVQGNVLLEVADPLEQHIIAALRRQPIVGLARAFESQLFLEELHGYVP